MRKNEKLKEQPEVNLKWRLNKRKEQRKRNQTHNQKNDEKRIEKEKQLRITKKTMMMMMKRMPWIARGERLVSEAPETKRKEERRRGKIAVYAMKLKRLVQTKRKNRKLFGYADKKKSES